MPRIRIDPVTIILFALLIILDGTTVSLIPFAAALCHELGHLIVMSAVGMKVSEVKISLLGADIKALRSEHGDASRLAVLLAGAAANIISGCVSLLIFEGEVSDFFAACSICLALFNLLPISTLDGGCVAQIICRRLFPNRYEVIIGGISAAALCLLWLSAVYLLLVFGGNISLMLFCMYMFAYLYLRR